MPRPPPAPGQSVLQLVEQLEDGLQLIVARPMPLSRTLNTACPACSLRFTSMRPPGLVYLAALSIRLHDHLGRAASPWMHTARGARIFISWRLSTRRTAAETTSSGSTVLRFTGDFEFELAAVDPGEVQQVVDQAHQPLESGARSWRKARARAARVPAAQMNRVRDRSQTGCEARARALQETRPCAG